MRLAYEYYQLDWSADPMRRLRSPDPQTVPPSDGYALVMEGVVEAPSVEDLLNALSQQMNSETRPLGLVVTSLSIGDIARVAPLDDGMDHRVRTDPAWDPYTVVMVGWQPIPGWTAPASGRAQGIRVFQEGLARIATRHPALLDEATRSVGGLRDGTVGGAFGGVFGSRSGRAPGGAFGNDFGNTGGGAAGALPAVNPHEHPPLDGASGDHALPETAEELEEAVLRASLAELRRIVDVVDTGRYGQPPTSLTIDPPRRPRGR